MWGAPKSKEGKSETSGCSGRAEVCKAAMHLLPLPPSPPPPRLPPPQDPFWGKLIKHFCLKGKIYFKNK